MTVQVGGWNEHRAVALVDGQHLVTVTRHPDRVIWRCFRCGDQGTPTCPHAQAFAGTSIPGATPATGPDKGENTPC